MSTTPASVVRSYYDALEAGDSLPPYFLEAASTVKFGIGESLSGYEDVAEALREQTRTTSDWTVESRALETTDRGEWATFADEVRMEWRSANGDRHRHETRWSGTLAALEEGDRDWQFVSMHVSVPREP